LGLVLWPICHNSLGEEMTEQLVFTDRNAFRQWLQTNHERPTGLWLVFGKNGQLKTLTPDEALEEALCFGWIDGLIKRVDDAKYVKFFSPRKTRSKWSERNKTIAERLLRSGLMAPPGLEAVERAKQQGLWNVEIKVQGDVKQLIKLLATYPKAVANFEKMSLSVQKLYANFYADAKQDATRERRLAKIVNMVEQNKKPMI
jgi:uncharacterized protein YdeI (YjbR/CyaY-like superfamily)